MSKSISFVIPMFNAEKFIGKCIDSIIAQNLGDSNYEIIVVDDGSRDKSKEIVQNHPCVKYFYKENGGQSTARNLGIEKATGDYICFVDADDYMIDNSIFCVVNMAEQNNLDMACYELGRPDEFKDTKNDFIESRIFSGGEYIAEYEFNNGPWWYLIRREFIEKNNLRFVEGRYGEDGMFTMLALLKAQRIQHCNQFCYCYVKQPDSTTTKKSRDHLLKVMDDYLFVSGYMRNLAEEHKDKIPVAAYERLIYRSESYLFFLLARLLRFPYEKGVIDKTIDKMMAQGVYPIRRPNPRYYSGLKYPLVTYVVNRKWLLKISNYLLSAILYNEH